jgi:hypothetical protein
MAFSGHGAFLAYPIHFEKGGRRSPLDVIHLIFSSLGIDRS